MNEICWETEGNIRVVRKEVTLGCTLFAKDDEICCEDILNFKLNILCRPALITYLYIDLKSYLLCRRGFSVNPPTLSTLLILPALPLYAYVIEDVSRRARMCRRNS